MGIGTTCVGENLYNNTGKIIHDSHSEILARRGFIRFLYECVEKVLIDKIENEYFNLNNENLLELKVGIEFHLLTTRPPCGDSYIYSLESYFDINNNNNEKSKCIEIQKDIGKEQPYDYNSCKMKNKNNLTGAKMIKNKNLNDEILIDRSLNNMDKIGVFRVKPGRGNYTKSMSCSDKLLKWCCLGIQGSLLMRFLKKPIYIKSIVMTKCLHNCKAIKRAIYKRIKFKNIFMYSQSENIPKIYCTSINFLYHGMFFGEKLKSYQKEIVICYEPFLKVIYVNGKKQGCCKKNNVFPITEFCKYKFFTIYSMICFKLKIEYEKNYKNAKKSNNQYLKAKEQFLKLTNNLWTNKIKEKFADDFFI